MGGQCVKRVDVPGGADLYWSEQDKREPDRGQWAVGRLATAATVLRPVPTSGDEDKVVRKVKTKCWRWKGHSATKKI